MRKKRKVLKIERIIKGIENCMANESIMCAHGIISTFSGKIKLWENHDYSQHKSGGFLPCQKNNTL